MSYSAESYSGLRIGTLTQIPRPPLSYDQQNADNSAEEETE